MSTIDVFTEFLNKIEDPEHRERTEEVLNWVAETFPKLEPVLKWNQPMFTDHDTYIIGFSVAKAHLAVAPENFTINQFSEKLDDAGYVHTNQLFRIKWSQPIDYDLLKEIIEFNIIDKANYKAFWRK